MKTNIATLLDNKHGIELVLNSKCSAILLDKIIEKMLEYSE